MLRMIVRTLKRLWLYLAAYERHTLANRAASVLRLHSTSALKDIGLNRGNIYSAAHEGCAWCHPKVWDDWMKDT